MIKHSFIFLFSFLFLISSAFAVRLRSSRVYTINLCHNKCVDFNDRSRLRFFSINNLLIPNNRSGGSLTQIRTKCSVDGDRALIRLCGLPERFGGPERYNILWKGVRVRAGTGGRGIIARGPTRRSVFFVTIVDCSMNKGAGFAARRGRIRRAIADLDAGRINAAANKAAALLNQLRRDLLAMGNFFPGRRYVGDAEGLLRRAVNRLGGRPTRNDIRKAKTRLGEALRKLNKASGSDYVVRSTRLR